MINLPYMISILNSVFTVVLYMMRDEHNKITLTYFKKINQLNLLYSCIRLYLQYILNYVFIVVLYMMR
jgi:hypothetical protein